MTQQSLITRLRLYEEALADPAIYCSEDICKVDDGEFCCRAKQKYALSDLRELIKEAEEQEQFGVWHSADDPDESDFFIGDAVDALDCDRCTALYTALGEKP